ncbi:hypothetical protein PGANDO_0554, partial [Porphyromonas gingivalis]
ISSAALVYTENEVSRI